MGNDVVNEAAKKQAQVASKSLARKAKKRAMSPVQVPSFLTSAKLPMNSGKLEYWPEKAKDQGKPAKPNKPKALKVIAMNEISMKLGKQTHACYRPWYQ